MYSDALMGRFLNPSHAGDLDEADGAGAEGNITCGDVVHLAIRVSDGTITAARFRAQGCATAIASADAVCEMITGTSVTEAQMLGIDNLTEMLQGVPPERLNCAQIVLEALRGALEETRSGRVPAGSG